MQGIGQQTRAGPSYLYWLRCLIHYVAHVLAKLNPTHTPGAAASVPIYNIVGVGITWTGPGDCRTPRALVQDSRISYLLPRTLVGYLWDWHTSYSRAGSGSRMFLLRGNWSLDLN